MKKIIASAVGLVLVGGVAVTTASAVESQFGGYWRTRSYFEKNFTQEATNDQTRNATDTRTRLYYTAKFSDDLKFVNKFEFNTTWGDSNGGDVGADGKGNWRIKNSYIDARLGDFNFVVGIQSTTIARGFIFGDDFSGAIVTGKFGKVTVPLMYAMVSQEDADQLGWDGSTQKLMGFTTNSQSEIVTTDGTGDIHMLSLTPSVDVSENINLNPHAVYANITSQDTYLWYLGTDVNMKFDSVTAWLSATHNGGSIDKKTTGGSKDADINAWLFAGGAEAGIVHGQAFYATGDDDATDNDIDSFVLVGGNGYGASYYWSEILGLGTFDNRVESNACLGDKISNIWAANVGVTLKPMDKMTVSLDAWYAENVEKVLVDGKNEDELGLELDAKLSYKIMDNLTADLIYAYLFAGDAVGGSDIQEGGVQLSLSF